MILGIAGTAKNTGKTTTTNAILDQAHKANLRVGLTSIGYDGEDIDHVTDLPKPRVNLEAGNLVAIAAGCLKGTKAKVRVLEETEISTPLGKIIIGQIDEGGRVVVAGPNKAKDLRIVLERLKSYGADLILVDGALNRLAPMVVTEGLILATGASRTPDIAQLAAETGAIGRILNLPITPLREMVHDRGGITLLRRVSRPSGGTGGGEQGEPERIQAESLPSGSLLLPAAVDALLEKVTAETIGLFVPGVIEAEALQRLVEGCLAKRMRGELILLDPIKLLVGGSPLLVEEMRRRLAGGGMELTVCTRLPLRLITVNPFYPRYRVQYRNYQPDYVDAEKLQAAIREVVTGRVVNVVTEGLKLEWLRE